MCEGAEISPGDIGTTETPSVGVESTETLSVSAGKTETLSVGAKVTETSLSFN